MVRSGIVISVSKATGSGVIQDAKKKEFYFNINECCDGEVPTLWSTVTFVKDPDFKSTNVAMLIKRSNVFKSIA